VTDVFQKYFHALLHAMGYRSYRIGMCSKEHVTIGLFDQWQTGIEVI
jgi:hypothetical protein